MSEKNYDFLKRHHQVHKPDRRDPACAARDDEVCLDSRWRVGGLGSCVTENAVADFLDYFQVSMGLPLSRATAPGRFVIWLETDPAVEKGFILTVEEDRVLVTLARDSEAFRAIVHLEDIMNLRRCPALPKGRHVRRPLYDLRSVHSGTGFDQFPDAELRALVHAGYNAIELYVKGIDLTGGGPQDIGDIIQRAKAFGVATMIKNSITTFIHPDDPKAPAAFDAAYGELFRRYPDAAGISFVGEALEFPSKDPHTTGKLYSQSIVDGIPDPRPSPGWYPCEDYPAYLTAIKNAVTNVKPDAIVIFSTYNIAYLPAPMRRGLLEKLPKGYSLSVSFDHSSRRPREGLKLLVKDYSVSVDTPSQYFIDECTAAKELGIPLWGNVNTTGIAWNFGCVPYVPAPRKVLGRMLQLRKAREEWGVASHYATHHFGWFASFASDLGKWSGWEDYQPDYEKLLEAIAIRDYGEEAAPHVLKAWELWSQAMDYYIASNDDQYGPWRVGAAYPFVFPVMLTRTLVSKEIQFPTAPTAYFGNKIIKTMYQPCESVDQAPGFLRYPVELRTLEKMRSLWEQGLAEAQKAAITEEGARFAALGQFILCSIHTTIHIKNWWLACAKMQVSASQAEALAYLDQLEAIAQAEIANTKACIPAVELDSRIGWEPSMEYVCDRWHLEWKLRQMDCALREAATYRQIVEEAYTD